MAKEIIPTTSEGLQVITVDLGGVTYTLEIFFNNRANGWYINILDSQDVPLVCGVRMVLDWPLFGYYLEEGLPVGKLVVQRTDSGTAELVQEDLGKNAILYYTEDT